MFELYISAVIFGLCDQRYSVSGIHRDFHWIRPDANHQHGADGLLYLWCLYDLCPGFSHGQFFTGSNRGTLVAARAGYLVETQLLRRVYGKELMFTMVVTFSVFMIGIGLVQYIFGLASKPVGMPFRVLIPILGAQVPLYRVMVFVISMAVYVLIYLFLNKTIVGKAIRAGIENPEQVQGLGINIRKIFTITFVVASGLAGFGGALNAPLVGVTPYMGFEMLLFAFITVILGGLGSIKGTLVSALIMGQVMSVGGTIYGPLAFVGPFMVMFVVILFRPTGLYGVKGRAFGFEE